MMTPNRRDDPIAGSADRRIEKVTGKPRATGPLSTRSRMSVVPSVQAATHRFVGATIYGEVGRSFFGIGGMGRTNLRPYWNLGFDPNDYVEADLDTGIAHGTNGVMFRIGGVVVTANSMTVDGKQGELSAMRKREQYSWGLLQGLWEGQPRR